MEAAGSNCIRMKTLPVLVLTLVLALLSAGCLGLTGPKEPQWNAVSDTTEAEYQTYLAGGTGSLAGQAFLTQRGGGVVTAAGRQVSLDPATTVGTEWWGKAGGAWATRDFLPPSPAFLRARRTTTADAEGRFRFSGLAPGRYYLRTEVTWEAPTAGGYLGIQGGLVGQPVEIVEGQPAEVILNQFTR